MVFEAGFGLVLEFFMHLSPLSSKLPFLSAGRAIAGEEAPDFGDYWRGEILLGRARVGSGPRERKVRAPLLKQGTG